MDYKKPRDIKIFIASFKIKLQSLAFWEDFIQNQKFQVLSRHVCKWMYKNYKNWKMKP